MSVTETGGHADEIGLNPDAEEAHCLLCGERVHHPAIYWHGFHEIYLHGPCAAELSVCLAHDVVELKKRHNVRWKREAECR